MGYIVRMPKLGLEMERGTLLEWVVEEGASVEEGDLVAEIESEKSIGEVEAREDGVLRVVYMAVDETVPPGTPMGIVAPPDEDISDLEAEAEADLEGEADEGGDAPEPADATAGSEAESATSAASAGSASGGSASAEAQSVKASPRAKSRAEELGVDLTGVDGTGPQGAITEDDVEAAADSGAGGGGSTAEDVKASPRAKSRAEELGVDLTGVDGTGPQGAITEDDVEAAADSAGGRADGVATGEVRWAEARSADERYERVTAVADPAAATALVETTDAVRNAFEEDVTMTDVLLVVAAEALGDCPTVNATFAESTHHLQESVDVALVAGGGDDENPTVGVLEGVQGRSLGDLVEARRSLADGDGPRPSFTLASATDGEPGGRLVNPPTVAALVVDPSGQRALPGEDGVDLQPLVRAGLTYDTRAIDESDARRFLDSLFDHAERAPEVVLGTYRGVE